VNTAPPAHAERLLEYVRILVPLVEAERDNLDAKRELSPGRVDALTTAGSPAGGGPGESAAPSSIRCRASG
jgi:hypothetical protein